MSSSGCSHNDRGLWKCQELGTNKMGSLSKSVPGRKKRLSSLPQYSDELDLDRQKQYPVKLMQHEQYDANQLVQKINQSIANHSTPEEMLREIAGLLGLAFQVDCCCLVTIANGTTGETIIGNWCAYKDLGLPDSDEILSSEQWEKHELVFACAPPKIEDINSINNALAIAHGHLPLTIKSVLVIPAKFGGKIDGVVFLIKSQPYEWEESEKQLLKAIEPSCAIAFSQVAQTQLIASQKKYVETCALHQSLIQKLTILGRSNLELNQMLQSAIAATAEALETDRGLLIFLKYTNPLFRNRSKEDIPKAKATVVGKWSNLDNPTINQLENQSEYSEDRSYWLIDCGLSRRAFSDSGKAVVINNNSDRRRGDTSGIAPVFALDILPALLLVPLESQGRVLGFLALQQSVARCWQDAELNMVKMVCAQLSNAIIQNQTLRQVRALVDERTDKLQGSLEVQAKLYERTRQYVKQLAELNELKDEFLSNMSDRLRYPLTNMRMALRNLRQPGIDSERQARYLDILEQECTKEINLVNDLLTLQKLETHKERPQLESIDLNTQIQHITESFKKKLADKGLEILFKLPADSLELQTEVKSFERILKELLSNVCKYSESDTKVELQAEHQIFQSKDRVSIKIINVGRGISQEEATYIFDKFRRGKGRWTPGTGLGLALVKSYVQHLNGTIAVDSSEILNSELSKICFTLTLPQFPEETEQPNESD